MLLDHNQHDLSSQIVFLNGSRRTSFVTQPLSLQLGMYSIPQQQLVFDATYHRNVDRIWQQEEMEQQESTEQHRYQQPKPAAGGE